MEMLSRKKIAAIAVALITAIITSLSTAGVLPWWLSPAVADYVVNQVAKDWEGGQSEQPAPSN